MSFFIKSSNKLSKFGFNCEFVFSMNFLRKKIKEFPLKNFPRMFFAFESKKIFFFNFWISLFKIISLSVKNLIIFEFVKFLLLCKKSSKKSFDEFDLKFGFSM